MEQPLSKLATEMANPATSEIDRMSPLEIVQAINAEDAKVARAVQHVLPEIAQAVEAIAERMRQGGRLIYVGAGTSGRLGALDASECPPTFNISPERVVALIAGGPTAFGLAHEDFEDSVEAGRADLAKVQPTPVDSVVGITASGRTPYVRGALAYARHQGALRIGLVCNPEALLAEDVTVLIAPQVGPEVLAGSTRMKAGTAQKMVLNMLSTGVMILLGKTFGNLMVDVQTSNDKLRSRAHSIIQQATGLDEAAAQEILAKADGETRTAILMAHTHLSLDEARKHLAAYGQVLRAALDAHV